jgi:hypothetical protein
MAFIAFVVVVILIGIYSAGGPYINSYMGHIFQTKAVGQTSRWAAPTNLSKNSQSRAEFSSDTLVCNLPDGWQIDSIGGKLWLTHYNLNGSIADSLPFDSIENFYQWFDTHPDCCDVDIEKLTVDELKDAEYVTTDMPNATSSASVRLTQ